MAFMNLAMAFAIVGVYNAAGWKRWVLCEDARRCMEKTESKTSILRGVSSQGGIFPQNFWALGMSVTIVLADVGLRPRPHAWLRPEAVLT